MNQMRLLLLNIVFFSHFSFSQSWNLDQCIDTALTQNYTLASSRINSQIVEENLLENRFRYIPSLNAGLTHGYNWGQTIDPFTNEFATNRVQFNNFFLQSSVSLFAGMRNFYAIRQNKNELEIESNQCLVEERNLKIDVATAYLQTLLNNEVLQISLEHLALSKSQLKKMEYLVESGKETSYKLSEIQAEVHRDEVSILMAQNDLNYSLLNLQQTINVPYDSSFRIQLSDTLLSGLLSLESTALTSVDQFPEVHISELNSAALDINQKYLESSLYPNLTLTSSIGTGYSANNTEIINGTIITKPFDAQLQDNFYQSAILSLRIPIFNQRSTTTQLKINELRKEQQLLDERQVKLKIQRQLEELKMNVRNSIAEYELSLSFFELMKTNFEHAEIQFENGKTPYSDYLEVKQQLYAAQSDLIQLKYRRYINQLILQFYAQ